MIDFSRVPFPDAPVGATVVGNIVDLKDSTDDAIRRAAATMARADAMIKEVSDSGAVVDLNKDGARRAIAAFSGKLAAMRSEAVALVVNSTESAKQATEMIGQVKRLAKAIDERRKEIIAEADSFVRFTNCQVKPLADELKEGEAILKRKLSDYAMRVELQRREIERKQREALVELQKQVDAEAKSKGVETVVLPPVAVPIKKEPVRSDSAVSSAVPVWKHEVIDAKLVPREYLIVDELAIRAAIKAGIRDIPGVRIFEEMEMRVRRVG